MKKLLVTAMITSALGACSLLPDPGTETRYVLDAVPAPNPLAIHAMTAHRVLSISQPQVPFDLHGSQLVLIRDGSLTYYAGKAWSAPVPDMLQAALVRDLSTALPGWVVSGNGNLRRQLELQVEVHNFATVQDAAGTAVVMNMDVRLVEPLNRRVVKDIPYRYRAALPELTTEATLRAYNDGWRNLIYQLAAAIKRP